MLILYAALGIWEKIGECMRLFDGFWHVFVALAIGFFVRWVSGVVYRVFWLLCCCGNL